MLSYRYMQAGNTYREANDFAIFKINNRLYGFCLYCDAGYSIDNARVFIDKCIYNEWRSGPGASLSLFEPKYIRVNRYDNYLFTREDIDNIMEILKSKYSDDNPYITKIKFLVNVDNDDIKQAPINTVWDRMIYSLYNDFDHSFPRFLNIPDYTKIDSFAENDSLSYDYIKYQIDIERKYSDSRKLNTKS